MVAGDGFAEGGTPCILPKVNATGGIGGLFEWMVHSFQVRQEDYLKHSQQRSDLEAAFSMAQRKFGDAVWTAWRRRW